MRLIVNKIYSAYDLIKLFGGNFQSSMPIINGTVNYCKFNPKINKKFPDEVWIEVGPIRKKAAGYLLMKKSRTPVFQKIQSNKWKFVGEAFISEGTTEKKLKNINKNPPRDVVQLILNLEF